jgi:hypothetical protein
VLFQAITAYADLFVACWLLASTYYLLKLVRGGAGAGGGLVPLLGLSLGLSLGGKISCAYYVALIALIAVTVIIAQRRASAWTAGRPIAILFAAIVMLSSLWYVRNWALTGSPTFPVALRLPGLTIFPGLDSRNLNPPKQYTFVKRDDRPLIVRWALYPWTEKSASEERGPGVQVAFLLPAMVVIAVARSVRSVRRRRRKDVAYLVVAAIFLGSAAAWWLFTAHEPRHALWLAGIVLAIGGFTASALRGRSALLFRLALLAAIVASLPAVRQPLLDRATYRWGNLCTWAQGPLISFIESVPDGSVFLNDVSQAKSGPCNTVLYGKRLQHRVVWSEKYFDSKNNAGTLSERMLSFGVDYVLYWRSAGQPVAAAYADETRFPIVFLEQKPGIWTTIHQVVH